MHTQTKVSVGPVVEKGDVFTFVTYLDERPIELTGTVEVMLSSSKARALGLTKSKRKRRYLGLRVEGYDRLFWKDKGQVKLVRKVEHRSTPTELSLVEEIQREVTQDLKEKQYE